jgi:exodeoxyribonuclease V
MQTSWSPQQSEALAAVKRWLDDPHAPQIFRLFGYAGSGKTTIAREIPNLCRGRVLYATFTGKAALVLQRKGCLGASTIHSLIYQPTEDHRGRTVFHLNMASQLAGAGCLVLDECSMVDAKMADDLASFGVRMLVLGDPEQLPPVKGAGALTDHKPDFFLSEIHRQAANNPIIRMSMDIREGRGIAFGTYGESRVCRMRDLQPDDIVAADQRVVGKNQTRRNWNRTIRELRGLKDHSQPVAGDRLICLRNNRENGLLNGGLWDTVSVGNGGFGVIPLTIREEGEGRVLRTYAWPHPFKGEEIVMPWGRRAEADEFDFGYTITAHKAQGSQWSHVVVRDESGVFREDSRRWLYTAVTRAAERVTVIRE